MQRGEPDQTPYGVFRQASLALLGIVVSSIILRSLSDADGSGVFAHPVGLNQSPVLPRSGKHYSRGKALPICPSPHCCYCRYSAGTSASGFQLNHISRMMKSSLAEYVMARHTARALYNERVCQNCALSEGVCHSSQRIQSPSPYIMNHLLFSLRKEFCESNRACE